MKNKITIGIITAVIIVTTVFLSSNTNFFQGSIKQQISKPLYSGDIRPDLTINEILLPASNHYSTYTISVSNRSNGCSGLPLQNIEVKLYPLYRLWSEPAGIQASIDANDIYTIFENVDPCSNWTKYWFIGLPTERMVRKLFPDGSLNFLARGTLMTIQAMVDPFNKIAESNEENNFKLEPVPMAIPAS